MRVKSPLKSAYNLLFKRAPMEAQLIITRRCNLSCGYCTEYDDVSQPVPLSELRQRIDALHRLGVINISILGGEPLMHPELDEIIRYAEQKAQVSVTTNGFLLTDSLIEKLNAAGLMNMEVSIDALSKDRSGYIQKTFATLQPKLKQLKELATFDVHVNIVLCDRTKDEFREMLGALKQMGLMVAVDLLHTPEGVIDIQGDDYVAHWEYFYRHGTPFSAMEYDYGKRLLEGKRPAWKCRAGSRFLYVDEMGKVQLCSSQRDRLNKSVVEYTKKDLREQHAIYKGCEAGCSLLCGYRDSIIDNAPWKAVKAAVRAIRMLS